MAKLVLLQGGEAVPFALVNGETVLGRHPECAIQLPSNMVSRRHAKIALEDGAAIIEDLGSGNGTYVNGQRIEGPTGLRDQDRVKLGPMLLRFESGKPVAQPVAEGKTIPDTSGTVFGDDDADFDVDFDEDDAGSSMLDAVQTVTGFGMLDIRPEEKLKAVISIGRALAGTLDVKAMLPKILDTLFEVFPHADRGCILLKDDRGNMIPAAQKHRRDDEDSTVRLSRTIVTKVLEDKAGILSEDAASDDRFEASESIANLTIRSMMCVPLLSVEGEPMGLVNIDTQNPINRFKKDDLDLLLAVAGQAALSYESARLLASFVAKQKQDNELEIARQVQQALLPENLPEVEKYEFYASYDSAQAVGGDYYDCIDLGEGRICVSFGDVAGKGVPGALIMSRMSSCVQNTMSFCDDVEKAVSAINDHMCANAVEGRFVTYVLAIVDTNTHEMTLVNAGHMSPMIRLPDGSVDEFPEETVGLPIGVVEGYPFDVVSRTIGPGEMVVLFTDGVDEAMNPAGDLYGLERLRDFVKNGPPQAEEMGRTLLEDVRKHADGRDQNDDITIMTFGRNPD